MLYIDRNIIPNRWELAELTIKEIEKFTELNNIAFDRIIINLLDEADDEMYGCYQPTTNQIEIFMKELKNPERSPSRHWSWPGNFIDCTAAGIITHEFGHWFVDDFGLSMQRVSPYITKKYGIANASSTSEERFVEALRLFILNPMLIKEARPDYWNFFTKVIMLKPIHQQPWRNLFAKAHPRYIDKVERWIEKQKDSLNVKQKLSIGLGIVVGVSRPREGCFCWLPI